MNSRWCDLMVRYRIIIKAHWARTYRYTLWGHRSSLKLGWKMSYVSVYSIFLRKNAIYSFPRVWGAQTSQSDITDFNFWQWQWFSFFLYIQFSFFFSSSYNHSSSFSSFLSTFSLPEALSSPHPVSLTKQYRTMLCNINRIEMIKFKVVIVKELKSFWMRKTLPAGTPNGLFIITKLALGLKY